MQPRRKNQKQNEIVVAGVRANEGVRLAMTRELDALVARMQADVERRLLGCYEDNPPRIAQDGQPPAVILASLMRALTRKWLRTFDDRAPAIAERYTRIMQGHADRTFAARLRAQGLVVKFQMTPTVRDVLQASIGEQVALIKSIGSEYLSDVAGLVMRSASQGRALGFLQDELQRRYGITQRRAAFIARDQNNKATATINRSRQAELGVKEALWMHSHGGRHPRPSHVKNDGKRYDIAKGWYDPDAQEWVWPGTLPNCRCFSKTVIPGIDD